MEGLTEHRSLQIEHQIEGLHNQIRHVQEQILSEEEKRKLLVQAVSNQHRYQRQVEMLELRLQHMEDELHQLIGERELQECLTTHTETLEPCSRTSNSSESLSPTTSKYFQDKPTYKTEFAGGSEFGKPNNIVGPVASPYTPLDGLSDLSMLQDSSGTASLVTRDDISESGGSVATVISMGSALTSSAGCLRVTEVNPAGHFVRLYNTSVDSNLDLSGYMLQQRIGGCPVAVYRIPQHTWMPAGECITIWAGGARVSHSPPSDLVWAELLRFRTGTECTTVLCKPSGQAVAWHVPTHQPSSLFPFDSAAVASNVKRSRGQKPTAADSPHSEPVTAEQWHTRGMFSSKAKRMQEYNSHFGAPSPLDSDPSMERSVDDAYSVEEFDPVVNALPSGAQLGNGSSRPISETTCSHPRSAPPRSALKTAHSVFQPRLNRKCPLVALTAQRTARSKYGFNFLSYPPITADIHVIRR